MLSSTAPTGIAWAGSTRRRIATAVASAALIVLMCAKPVSATVPREQPPQPGDTPAPSSELYGWRWADDGEPGFYDRYVTPAKGAALCVVALPDWWAGLLVGALECGHVWKVGVIVLEYANEFFGDDDDYDRHNAFRHCLWSGWLTLDFGDRAARATDAHEVGASEGGFDRLVDLINNAIGAYYATLINADDSLSDREKDQTMAFTCWLLAEDERLAGIGV